MKMKMLLRALRVTAFTFLCFLLWFLMPATAHTQERQPSGIDIARQANSDDEALAHSLVVQVGKGEKEFESRKAADLALGLKYFQIAERASAGLTPDEKHRLLVAIVPELERGKALLGHQKEVPVETRLQKRETREEIRAIDRKIKTSVEEILGTKKVQELQLLKPLEKVLPEPHSCWDAYYSQVYSYWTLYYAYWTYVLYGTLLDYYTYIYAYYSDVYAWYAYLNLCS